MDGSRHIVIVESFYSGSHKYWADQLAKHFRGKTTLVTLPGRHWKWRMSASAIELADKVNRLDEKIDVFLVSDLIDLSDFKVFLKPEFRNIPVVLYMHENQVVYPYRTEGDERNRDRHYGMINYKSVLCADEVWFNSEFHRTSFTSSMESFLKPFPDSSYHIRRFLERTERMKVVYLGVDTLELEKYQVGKGERPTILWNHRWEFDKNPETFFLALTRLSREGVEFDLIVCGEHYSNHPSVFDETKQALSHHIVHWGYFENRSQYIQALWQSHVLPVTSDQEFFGLSVMEAVYCGCTPILPDRLSYPELYPEEVLYKDEEEFYLKLKKELLEGQKRDHSISVANFSWAEVIKTYEAGLSKLLSGNAASQHRVG